MNTVIGAQLQPQTLGRPPVVDLFHLARLDEVVSAANRTHLVPTPLNRPGRSPGPDRLRQSSPGLPCGSGQPRSRTLRNGPSRPPEKDRLDVLGFQDEFLVSLPYSRWNRVEKLVHDAGQTRSDIPGPKVGSKKADPAVDVVPDPPRGDDSSLCRIEGGHPPIAKP